MSPPPAPTPTRDEAVPTGWKLVPVDPTEEMIEAMREAARKASRGGISGMTIDAQFRAEHRPEYASYTAMLASAPAPASGGVDAVAEVVAEELALKIVSLSVNWLREDGTDREHDDYVRANWTKEIAEAKRLILAALSPAATPVSEAEPAAWRYRYRGSVNVTPDEAFAREQGTNVEPLYLAKPASSPAGGDVHWTIESLAQWLHDETEHQESYSGCHWPEHPDDDGNRDGGFIKIVPKHAQAYFRQMAARCMGVRPFSDAYFRALKGEPALSQSTSAGRVGE